MNGNLWFDDEGGRWFVVPDECAADNGSLKVRDPDGDHRTLDPVQAAPWEVDDATGRGLLEDYLRGQATQIEDVFKGLVGALGDKPLDLNDEAAATDAMASAFKGLLGALGGAFSEDPAVRAKATERLSGAARAFATSDDQVEKLETMGREARETIQKAVQDLDADS